MYVGLIHLVSRCPCRSLKTRMNLLYILDFTGRIRILLLSYSYNTNIYLLTMFEVTGNLPVRYLDICLLWLMILVNTVLVCCASGVIVGYSCIVRSCRLVDLRLILVWLRLPLAVTVDGGRCLLISSIVKFGHVLKYPFLIIWRIVFLTGINSVVWYHCSISGLIISAIRLFYDLLVGVGIGCGVVDRCTCHIPATPLRFTSRTVSQFYLL